MAGILGGSALEGVHQGGVVLAGPIQPGRCLQGGLRRLPGEARPPVVPLAAGCVSTAVAGSAVPPAGAVRCGVAGLTAERATPGPVLAMCACGPTSTSLRISGCTAAAEAWKMGGAG